jgi:hypothetical protein
MFSKKNYINYRAYSIFLIFGLKLKNRRDI